MDRRDFLKMLGFGAAAAVVPFSRAEAPKLGSKLDQAKLRIEAIENGNTNYKLIIVDSNGNHMWAPPVKEFIRDGDNAIFVAEDVPIDITTLLVSAKLLTPDGDMVGEQVFAGQIPATYGDIIKITYKVQP